MLKKVIIAHDPFDKESYEIIETENVIDTLKERYEGQFPKNARIYIKDVSVENDVTPSGTEKEIEAKVRIIEKSKHDIHVVNYPGDGITIAIVIGVVIVGAAVVLTAIPSVPTPSLKNTQQTSPNNELSDRKNIPRPNGRIPDIFGTVRSTPDLIAVPYKIFDNNREFEVAYMSVGRGAYEVSDIRDGNSLIENIAGASVAVYAPNTSPNSGTPYIQIGDSITDGVLSVIRINEVNGQTAIAPNKNKIKATDVKAVGSNQGATFDWLFRNDGSFDWDDYFEAGDIVNISNSSYIIAGVNGGNAFDLDGAYTIVTISNTDMVVQNAISVNSNWGFVNLASPYETEFSSLTAALNVTRVIGPFFLNFNDTEQIFVNFIAQNGIYKDDGTNQVTNSVTIRVELTPTDQNGVENGTAEFFDYTIEGSAVTRDQRALTAKITPTVSGRMNIRIYRTSDTDIDFSGSVVDDVKVRDVYVVKTETQSSFGDITTIQSKTFATSGALAVKERKLNCQVTRKIPTRNSGSDFTTTLHATNRADDILSFICLDPYIGNRPSEQIDFDNIYDTVQAVYDYFGIAEAVEFNYTFDKENLSFEETIQIVANAIFCTAYRQSNKIQLSFEEATEDSVLLFNHRNKIPETEKRTFSFGNTNEHDGVEFEYVNPNDSDAIKTIFIPSDKSAINSKKVESLGIRSHKQAYFHAWRIYNKILYQNVSVEFEATQEAAILVNNDRILVADNTRTGTQDGEVENQDALFLTLSNKVTLEQNEKYIIQLQHFDGTTETIDINYQQSDYEIVLMQAPRQSLATNENNFARATYNIIKSDSSREKAFILTERDASSDFVSRISAINYTFEYYQNDQMSLWINFENGIVNESFNNDISLTNLGAGSVVTDSEKGIVFRTIASNQAIETNFQPSQFYTKSLWVKRSTSNEGGGHFISSGVASNFEEFAILDDGTLYISHNGVLLESSAHDANNKIKDTNWHHIACSYSSAFEIIIFIDGVEVIKKSNFVTKTDDILKVLGKGENLSNSFIGKIADLRYYNRALSKYEIKQLYLRGKI